MTVLWMAFASNFGRSPENLPADKNWTGRMLRFNVYLIGTLVFLSYQASLTSILTARLKIVPFDSHETFLLTNYK
jgi:hypothetical protein